MKAKTLHELNDVELTQKLEDLKVEFFNLRFQKATGQLAKPKAITEIKKDIARVKTISASASTRRQSKEALLWKEI